MGSSPGAQLSPLSPKPRFQNIDHEKDIIMLKDVGHFPYFEEPDVISKELVQIIKGK